MSAQWAVPTRAGSVESTILSNISYVAQSNVAQRPKRQNPMRQRWGGHPPPAPPWRMAPVAATHLHHHGAPRVGEEVARVDGEGGEQEHRV